MWAHSHNLGVEKYIFEHCCKISYYVRSYVGSFSCIICMLMSPRYPTHAQLYQVRNTLLTVAAVAVAATEGRTKRRHRRLSSSSSEEEEEDKGGGGGKRTNETKQRRR